MSVALALQLEVGGEGAQAVHLVAHFAGRGVGRLAQALVLRLQPIDERVSSASRALPAAANFCLVSTGMDAGGKPLRKRGGIFLGEDLLEGQLVAAQQLGNRRLDERGGEARDGRRLAASGRECARRERVDCAR